MSLLWRNPIQTTWLMLKSAVNGLARACGCCPCNDWYIVTVCPCNLCVQPGKCFVGEPVEGETGEIGEETYPLTCLHMVDHGPFDANNPPPGEVQGHISAVPWECVPTYKNCTLWAIIHQTRVAPAWPGYLNVVVYLDGVPITEWDATPYVPEERAYIGDGVSGRSGTTKCLEVGYEFTQDRDYVLDLKVSFMADDDDSHDPVIYTCRNIIRVGDIGNSAWLGDTFIVPSWFIQMKGSMDDCDNATNAAPGYSGNFGLKVEILRGPFDTLKDAKYVHEHWADLIAAYALTCVCNADMDDDGEILYFDGSVDPPDENGWVRLNRFGTGGDYTAIILPRNSWVQYDSYLTGGDSYDTQARLYDEYGNYTTASQSGGYVPPCSELSFWVKQKVSEPDPSDVVLGGAFWVVGTGVECVLTDPESEFYEADWDYNMGSNQGVPNNSVELADYLESLEE